MSDLPAVLITGASTGIGAAYAARFAARGHDLVLVARDQARLNALEVELKRQSGVSVEVLKADLTRIEDLEAVGARLRDDARIGVLVNNAGANVASTFTALSTAQALNLVALNTTAVVALTSAIAPRLAKDGAGAIVNIGSVVGLVPEYAMAVYGATKAFVLHFSQALSVELGPQGVYVQAVLPSGTRTELWDRAGANPDTLPPLMDTQVLVDAALVGFDRREAVTIPPLHDAALWDTFEGARRAMITEFGQIRPADRYLAAS